ncbi:MAG: DNA primase [Bacteroidetes bacterium]|nr:DNA primase [Bacteroidota bacterium]
MIANTEEIKNAVQINDILGDFITLKKKGINYTACCPFHNEKTPSFIVNPARGSFKCFGCGKSGDAIEFLREHEAMSYTEALTYIAGHYNIPVKLNGSDQQYSEAEKRRDGIFAALKWAQQLFSANLQKNKPALSYLQQRKLEQAIDLFLIGYAETGNDLFHKAQQAGFSSEILLAAGLLKKNDQGHLYDAFSRRIIFPFFDRTGRVIGFTGRLITTEKDKPKYLNSAETEVFKKSRFLYGLYQSKKEIMKENECLLVEGQTDLISWHLAGIKNVVAGSGTALSEDQVKMILSLTSCLTIVYDGDPAGIKASVSNIRLPLQMGLDVYLVVLPDGEDPDSYVIKYGAEKLKHYIEDNRKDIVSFRIEMVKEQVEKDPLQKARHVKELVSQISLISDEETRGYLITDIAKKLEVNPEDMQRNVKKQLPKVDKTEKGFFGLDASVDMITEIGFAILLSDPVRVVSYHAEGKENTISLPAGPLKKDDLFRLSKLTRNVKIEGLSKVVDDNDTELPLTEAGRMLTEQGLRVEVREDGSVDETTEDEKEPVYIDFLDFYVHGLTYRLIRQPDTKRSKKFVEMTAEFLSKLDNTIIHIKTNEIAKKFGLTQGAFSKVLRPFVEKRKNLAVQQQEHVVINDEQYVFDIAHLPDYVDQSFFQRYGFFPAQNNSGNKIFYVFRTLDNTLIKVGNFYMEPLFQVHDPDPIKNKRFIKLFHSELGKEEYVEFKSSDMIELAPFKKFLWNTGAYIFTNGKQFHHEKILESISLQFPKCHELSIFGSQPEGFFAFSNGIISDGVFHAVDELGLVKFKRETYYLPAFSKIYKDQRTDNDKYEYDRFLVYKHDQHTSWQEWAELMYKVYTYNNNGMWALLFTLLSVNRSIIFPIERFFTSLFFIGPTESGKSRIAESIRAPFMYGAPLFNLNSGTDAAFFTSLERFRDIPVIFEEYNDYQISDVKFQGLKAAVYDNEGKQKRKDATSKDIDVSKIYGCPLLLGQDGPERDDGALGNRVVQKHVPKKDNWTEEEVSLYTDLKKREADGLSNIAMEIIKRRPLVQQYFAGYMRQYQKKVKEDIRKEGGTYQTRMINTVSLFIAMAKMWEDHVKELPLPFSFNEFYEDAKRQIIRQSEELSTSNKLSVFFDTISMLYAQGQIISGREFDISTEKRVTLRISRTETEEKHWDGEEKKLLFLIINDVVQIYQKMHSSESLKLNSLRMYLKDHPAYIGAVKGHRFIYQVESWETDPATGINRKVIQKAERVTSCIVLDYKIIEAMGIDLERFKTPEQTSLDLNDPEKLSDQPGEQNEFPF